MPMPKAVIVAPQTLALISEETGWAVNHLQDTLNGLHYYVQYVQFPHGYIDHAIVTYRTFEATFKWAQPYDEPFKLEPVDYR